MFLEEVIEETLKDYSTADLSDFTVRLEIAETIKRRFRERMKTNMKPKLQEIAENMERAANAAEKALAEYTLKKYLENTN